MDGEAAKVGGDPAAAQLFSDGGRGAGAAEAVEDEVARVGGRGDNAFEQGFRLLSCVPSRLRVGMNSPDHLDVVPEILKRDTFTLI